MIVTFANFQRLVNDFDLITFLNHSELNLGTQSQCVLNFPTYSAKWWYLFFVSILPDIIPTDYSNSRSISSWVLPVSSLKKQNKKLHVCLLHCCFLKMSMQCFFFCYLISFLNSFWIYFIYSPFQKKCPPPFSSLSHSSTEINPLQLS